MSSTSPGPDRSGGLVTHCSSAGKLVTGFGRLTIEPSYCNRYAEALEQSEPSDANLASAAKVELNQDESNSQIRSSFEEQAASCRVETDAKHIPAVQESLGIPGFCSTDTENSTNNTGEASKSSSSLKYLDTADAISAALDAREEIQLSTLTFRSPLLNEERSSPHTDLNVSANSTHLTLPHNFSKSSSGMANTPVPSSSIDSSLNANICNATGLDGSLTNRGDASVNKRRCELRLKADRCNGVRFVLCEDNSDEEAGYRSRDLEVTKFLEMQLSKILTLDGHSKRELSVCASDPNMAVLPSLQTGASSTSPISSRVELQLEHSGFTEMSDIYHRSARDTLPAISSSPDVLSSAARRSWRREVLTNGSLVHTPPDARASALTLSNGSESSCDDTVDTSDISGLIRMWEKDSTLDGRKSSAKSALKSTGSAKQPDLLSPDGDSTAQALIAPRRTAVRPQCLPQLASLDAVVDVRTPLGSGVVNPGFVFEFPPSSQLAGQSVASSPGVTSPLLLDVLHKKYCTNTAHRQNERQTSKDSSESTSSLQRPRRDSYKRFMELRNNGVSSDHPGISTMPTVHSAGNIRMFGNVESMFNTMPVKFPADAPRNINLVKSQNSAAPPSAISRTEQLSSSVRLTRKFSLSPKLIRRKIIARLQEQGEKTSSDSEDDWMKRARDGSAATKRRDLELEAIEACCWLGQAGFSQYVQLFEESQFPIDLQAVEKDHSFLDKQQLQSLFRRLTTLNKSASMKLEIHSKKPYGSEDADDEDACVLSDKWRYERASGRWSHIDASSKTTKANIRSCSSRDSVMTDDTGEDTGDSSSPVLTTRNPLNSKVAPSGAFSDDSSVSPNSPKMSRLSEKKSNRSESFLQKVGSLRRHPTKKRNAPANGMVISGPTLVSSPELEEKMQRLGCVDISSKMDCDILNNNNKLMRSASVDNACICETCSLDSAYTEFLLPPGFVRGTFPKILETTVRTKRSRNNSLTDQSFSRTDQLARLDASNTHSTLDSAGSGDHLLRRRHSHESGFTKQAVLRRSVYDNVPCDEIVPTHEVNTTNATLSVPEKSTPEVLSARQELDAVLQDLFLNIRSLSGGDDKTEEFFNLLDNQHSSGDSAVVSPTSDDLSSLTDTASNSRTPADTPELKPRSSKRPSIPRSETGAEEEENRDDSIWRERRDSGVGSSLTREPAGERKKQRLRWHSFVASHRPSFNSENLNLAALSAGQLLYLKRLSLLKVTSLMEQHSPNHKTGWTMLMNRLMKKTSRVPEDPSRHVFGVPLSVTLQRSGQPLPQCIQHAMRFLRKSAAESVGIFRKSGVKSRIQKLRNDLENDQDSISQLDCGSVQAYDVADMFKQYLRELPECLLTNKLSETFLAIYQHVPSDQRLEALQACVLLLPDENREVLESLLYFLSDMAAYSEENHMNASNLAMCFAPSLFNIHNRNQPKSPKIDMRNMGIPDQREFQEQKSATDCLTSMINECKNIFKIPEEFLSKCHLSYMEVGNPAPLSLLGTDGSGYHSHIESCIQGLLKECKEKGWTVVPVGSAAGDADLEVSYKKVHDGNPLRLWKCSTVVEAPPCEVLHRVLNERQKWDEDFIKWRSVEKLDENVDVFQYMNSSMAPQPARDYVVLRAWRADLAKGSCALIAHSIEHDATSLGAGIRGIVLASRYLIEPCGSGRSRITHISRVDTRGRSAEWYNKSFGHISGASLVKIKESFSRSQDIANVHETKV